MMGTAWSLHYAKRLVREIKDNRFFISLLFCALNGILMVAVQYVTHGNYPVVTLLGGPIMVIAELMLITRDVPYTYGFVFNKILMNFFCIYWMLAALIGLCTVNQSMKDIFTNSSMLMSIALLVSTGWLLTLTKSSFYPFDELYKMIHHPKIGKVFSGYLVICNLFYTVSSFTMTRIIDEGMLEGRSAKVVLLDTLMKTLLIFLCSYLILFIETYEIRFLEKNQVISNDLDRERSFRNNVQKKGLLRFFANISQNQILEGSEQIKRHILGSEADFMGMAQRVAMICVHPEDREEFLKPCKKEFIEDVLDNNPFYSHQLRFSPDKIQDCFHLSPQFKERMSALEKEWLWVKVDYVFTRDVENGDVYFYVVFFDVDNQVMQREKLRLNATMDALTGIYNRATLEDNIRQRLADKNAVGAMFLLDIDNFKAVNDILGHPQGDQLLKDTGWTLRRIFRSRDVIGRLGGDEFCVFLPGTTNLELLEDRAKEINNRCRKNYYGPDGETIRVSVSIGVAVTTENCRDYETLYKNADIALYETKNRSKDSYSIYQNK
jgi:diguanylate cyclase (GGDEF)-like protein